MDKLPDAKELLLILWRRKWHLLIIALVPVLLGFIVIKNMPSRYRATAEVLIEKQELNLANFQDAFATVTRQEEQIVQTQVNLINSSSLALRTVKEAELYKHPAFNPAIAQGLPMSESWEGEWDIAHGKVRPEDVERYKVLSRFMSGLEVYPQGSSQLVKISFVSQDPVLAARVVNIHTQKYIEYSTEVFSARTRELSEWILRQIRALEEETLKKQKKVQEFRAHAGLVLGKGSEELIYQQISDTASQLTPVETRKLELDSRREAIMQASQQGKIEAVGQVIASQLIQNLKAQEALAEQRLQVLRSNYGERHPTLIAAQREVDEVRQKIGREVALIAESVNSELLAVSRQEQLLKNKLSALQTRADRYRKDKITLSALEREAESSQKALDNFLGRYEEINSQTDLTRSNARLISWAEVPVEAFEPNKPFLFMAVIVLSGGVALAVVFLLEMLYNGFRNLDEVRLELNRTPLGITSLEKDPLLQVRNHSESVYTESIKKIYMYGLMGKRRNQQGKVVLVSSALPNEGKSTFVMSMAYYLSSIGKKVVVVDTDTRRPHLHELAKIGLQPGFTDLLTRDAVLEQAIKADFSGKIHIIPAGTKKMLPPDLLNSQTSIQLVEALRQRYDYILYDSPPLLALSDAAAVSSVVDEVIVIARWLQTSKKKTAYAIATLEELIKRPILGVVLTKVDVKKYAMFDYGDAGIYFGLNKKYYSSNT